LSISAAREGELAAFPVQVRAAYLALLVAGLYPPLGFIHWVQLVGTWAMVLVGYCPLARALSLLPWNRSQPLSAALVRRTFVSAGARQHRRRDQRPAGAHERRRSRRALTTP